MGNPPQRCYWWFDSNSKGSKNKSKSKQVGLIAKRDYVQTLCLCVCVCVYYILKATAESKKPLQKRKSTDWEKIKHQRVYNILNEELRTKIQSPQSKIKKWAKEYI